MPRRVRRKSKGRHASAKPREPLAEGVVPLNGHGHRAWVSVSDNEIVSYTKRFMKKRGISGRRELDKADGGLYYVLRKRKLLDKVGFEEKLRDWASMSDDELVAFAERFMEEKKISGRRELQKADSGLYYALQRRKLLDRVGFEEKQRNWKLLSDTQLIEHAKQFMEEKEISGRTELRKADYGLCLALQKRKLLDRIVFEEKYRDWSSLSDAQLVEHTRKFMEERRISGRTELAKADHGLYLALYRRKLVGKVGFEDKKRDWSSFSDAQLIEYARQSMEENDICGRRELWKVDKGLYNALCKRKLLDRVGFEEKQRSWSSLSHAQLVEHTRLFMEEKRISSKKELKKADSGLYYALQRRKLLDRVGFEEIRRNWSSLSNAQLVEHARKFMEERRIRGRTELYKTDSGLYQALLARKLLDNVGFEKKKRKRRDWRSLSDAELVEHARQFMKERGISSRRELWKVDKGLYGALKKRKLLDRAFADIDQAKEREEAQALFDGLAEFGGAQ